MPDTRQDAWSAFIRRLAETQAKALAGDERARTVLNEYGLCRWSGHRPDDALAVAESMYDAARRAMHESAP